MKLPAASPHRLTRAMRHSVGGVSAPASLRSALASTRQAAGNVPSYDSTCFNVPNNFKWFFIIKYGPATSIVAGLYFHALTSIPFLKVKRMSSLLYTVAYSTRLYQSSSLNFVSGPSICSRQETNRPIFSRFACRSVMAHPTSSSRAFAPLNRSASPSYFF